MIKKKHWSILQHFKSNSTSKKLNWSTLGQHGVTRPILALDRVFEC